MDRLLNRAEVQARTTLKRSADLLQHEAGTIPPPHPHRAEGRPLARVRNRRVGEKPSASRRAVGKAFDRGSG